MRGAGRNFALLTAKGRSCRSRAAYAITPLLKDVIRGAVRSASFQPFVNSPRNPSRSSSFGCSLMMSSAYAAPSSERQLSGVEVGATVKVETVPCRKLCSVENDACPY